MTLPQFDVLSELEHASEQLTMSQLSKELMVSNGNITGVVDRLEKNKLVVRIRPEHDRRVQYIELTAEGKDAFRRMARKHEQWLEEWLANISIEEMDQLQSLLLKARDSVSAASGGPA